MKLKNKLIASLGVTTVIAAPIGVVITTQHNKSKGNLEASDTILKAEATNHDQDQSKMDNITQSQFISIYGLSINNNTYASSQVSKIINKNNISLNGLSGLDVAVSNVYADDSTGKLWLTAEISKPSASAIENKIFENISVDNFKVKTLTDQGRLDAIGEEDVDITFGLRPDGKITASTDVANIRTTSALELNGLTGVTITVNGQPQVDDKVGTIVYSVTISKDSLVPKVLSNIIVSGYLKVGTGIIDSATTPNDFNIDSTHTFSQKIDATHYLVGTNGNGVYQLTLNDSDVTKVVSATKIPTSTIPDVTNGWIQQIGSSTHYLIGTAEAGVYQVTVDPDSGTVTSATAVSTAGSSISIPGVATGWIQAIDDSHYLIGTETEGVYQVTVDTSSGAVTKSTQVKMSGDNSIPNVSNGWVTKIDLQHYLIGSKDDGAFEVTVDGNGMVSQSNQVASDFISSTSFGWAQQVDETHYLIGSTNGVYQVTLNSEGQVIASVLSNIMPPTPAGWCQKFTPYSYWIATATDGIQLVSLFENS